jgi:FkbM family methyltransferase
MGTGKLGTARHVRSNGAYPWAVAGATQANPREMPNPIGVGADTSQRGEVDLLRQIVDPSFPGFIVDVGAHDGRTLSNSFPFISEGWKGVLVEPLPDVFDLLQRRYRDRDDVHCFQCACSDTAGSQPLFIGKDGRGGMLSSLRDDDDHYWRRIRGEERIEVKVTTLSTLLEEAGAPSDFSILAVDTEGNDYEVLRGLDFDRFRPRIVLTEEWVWQPRKHWAKYRLLRDRGYFLWVQPGANSIWVDRRFRDRFPTVVRTALLPMLRARLHSALRLGPVRARFSTGD